ncbi:MAG: 6-carboxytetrahydropterin synthase [Deltaproteobacteria bacterium]|nr:6-carboxytetrahydropterin synthase [Deltaproteobacteria bacterium]
MHYLKSKITFAASHQLVNQDWDTEKNRQVYGKCSNRHGHNYTVEVTVKGPCDPVTGMVLNFTQLKHLLKEIIYSQVDHKDLNQDVPFLTNVPPTAENLACVFWNLLKVHMPENIALHEIMVQESEKNTVYYHE